MSTQANAGPSGIREKAELYVSETTRPTLQPQNKEGGPLFRGPLPFYEALEAPAHPSSKPGSCHSDPPRVNFSEGAKLLRSYFFLVFLVAFFFIVLLSLGLDFDLAAALPGFLLTGIRTSSRVRCCGLSLKNLCPQCRSIEMRYVRIKTLCDSDRKKF